MLSALLWFFLTQICSGQHTGEDDGSSDDEGMLCESHFHSEETHVD